MYANYDSRDYQYAPTQGLFIEAEYLKSNNRQFNSTTKNIYVAGAGAGAGAGAIEIPGLSDTVNKEVDYTTLRLDARTYEAISSQTTLALRGSAVLNSEKAPNNATALDDTGTSLGFTREIQARSVVGAQAQASSG